MMVHHEKLNILKNTESERAISPLLSVFTMSQIRTACNSVLPAHFVRPKWPRLIRLQIEQH